MSISKQALQKSLSYVHFLLVFSLVACSAGANAGMDTSIAPSATVTAIAPDGVFWIDPSQDLGTISRLVYGANHGPWADLGVANLEPAKNAGITFLRWPGGNWGDQNDLQTYQVDNYIRQAHMMGAEPSITVRLLGGTPEQAAQLVKYTNVDMGYGVKYWSIGNEPDLYIVSDSTWTPEYYAKKWREFALAMKAVDPTIKFYGPEISAFLGDADHFDPREYLYANSVKLDFTKHDYLVEFLKVNADLVDIVAVHQYPFPKAPKDGVPTWEQLRENEAEWDRIIPNLRRIVKETIGTDKPVGMTEFNSNASNAMGSETSTDSFYNGLWLADILGRMIRTQPDIAAYWLLKNNFAGHGLMTSFDLHPTYYVYQLYKRFGDHLLAAKSPEIDVSLFAAKREDGTITAIFVNNSNQEISKPFKLENGDGLKIAEVYLLDAAHNAESIIPPAFSNGNEIVLPKESATLYILK